ATKPSPTSRCRTRPRSRRRRRSTSASEAAMIAASRSGSCPASLPPTRCGAWLRRGPWRGWLGAVLLTSAGLGLLAGAGPSLAQQGPQAAPADAREQAPQQAPQQAPKPAQPTQPTQPTQQAQSPQQQAQPPQAQPATGVLPGLPIPAPGHLKPPTQPGPATPGAQPPAQAEPPAPARRADSGNLDILPVPPLSGHVIDQTGTLSQAQHSAIDQKLIQFEKERGTQIVVLMVPSTLPEDIAAYAQRVGDNWKIGRREVGDGLLLVVAKEDRRVRIEVAKALEGAIPDLAASGIIERVMLPAFKAGDFAAGIDQGLDHLMARVVGENLPLPAADGRGGSQHGPLGFDLQDLLFFGLVGVPILFGVLSSIFGRKAGALATGLVTGGAGWLMTASL